MKKISGKGGEGGKQFFKEGSKNMFFFFVWGGGGVSVGICIGVGIGIGICNGNGKCYLGNLRKCFWHFSPAESKSNPS